MTLTRRYMVVGASGGIGLRHSIADFDVSTKSLDLQLEEWAKAAGFLMDHGVVAIEVSACAGGPLGQGPKLCEPILPKTHNPGRI